MPRRCGRASALAAIPIALALGCGRAPSPPPGPTGPPSVLLVTIDTWRWDHLGASGQDKVATPNLDRLAAQGVYLKRVQTSCPLTTPAHATILTGLTPHDHGIRDNTHFTLRPDVTTLAQRFEGLGYATGAVVSGAPLRRAYGLDRGFASYDDQGLVVEGGSSATPSSRPASDATSRALAWIRARTGSAPLFLWAHYYDAHEPYAPPSPFRERYAARPYAGEVAYVDASLAPLLDAVRGDRGRRWIVVVTGDHGEGLGDHGESTHGVLLYGSTLTVPLIVWGAGHRATPSGPFGLVDVAATICDLAGLEPPPGEGRSIFARGASDRWIAAETAYPATGYGLAPAHLLRRGGMVWVDHGAGAEVYDLEQDPFEAVDLVGTAAGAEFARQAEAERDRAFGDDAELGERTLSLPDRDLEALRGLGYVARPPGATGLRRVDLRRFVLDLATLQQARDLTATRRFADALRSYDAFIASYPNSGLAFQERGQVLVALGRAGEAAASFARALALDPRDAVSALDLGNLALARGDFAGAEGFYLESLRSEEGQPEAHLDLALLYVYKLDRPAEARSHLERFLALAPGDPEAGKVRELLAALPAAGSP